MEEKLLKVFKLADKLNSKNTKKYEEIHYEAHDSHKLQICIIRKKDYSYIERCEICITENSEEKWNNVITLFDIFVGGVRNMNKKESVAYRTDSTRNNASFYI